ncbi:MAG: folylpolyglutamate synthase/dihydrofolate synthase family protein [Eubacteriales bacterium]
MLQDIQTYEDAVNYILEVPKFTKKNTIEQTTEFYEYLKKPGNDAKIIHVAGTNGKGSVCAYLQSILFEGEVKTGMFTSPHLIDIRERFQIDKNIISKEIFLQIFGQIRDAIIEFNHEKQWLQKNKSVLDDITQYGYHPTFFELLFFIAMIWFEQQQAAVIILETGLGGRLDATNIIKQPAISVITEIGLDHMEYLGNTLTLIAKEKAGIMKHNTPIIYIEQKKECESVILEEAKKMHIKIEKVSKMDDKSLRFHNKSIDFLYESRYYDCIEVNLSTVARYQVDNANLAIATIDELWQGETICVNHIAKGLKNARWAGRMEEIIPDVFVDGAHNEDGILAFLETLKKQITVGRSHLLFSAVGDKQYEAMLKKLIDSQVFTNIVVTPIKNGRSLDRQNFTELKKAGLPIEIVDSAEKGFQFLVKEKKENDKIYIVGSLYLVGQMKQYLQENGLK